jgi:tetratricopeptide (TPR) repeat protein
MLSTEALHANLSSILNQLTHIQQLLRLFREQTKHDVSIISNLEKCAWSAGKLVSTTRSSIYLPNDQVEINSEAEDELKDLQNRRVANWLPEVSSTVDKEEFNIDSKSKRLANDDFRYGHRSTAPSIDSTPSTLQRSDAHDSQTDLSLNITKRPRIHRKEESNDTSSDVDIQQWLKSGTEQFAAKDYEKAEVSLERVLKRSQSKHGTEFAWRDETIRMLVVIYCHLGNWVEAKELLNQNFADKDKTLETLAAKFCQERRWDDAGRLLRYEFEGRENGMERVARAYVLDQKWSQAKKILLELIKYKAEESIRGLERMYILAEVCHWKGDLEDTKEWCLTALQGPKTVLEKLHPLFHQFVKLLVQACEDQHDVVGAEKYRALLSSDVQGINISQRV